MYITPTGGALLPESSRAMRKFANASKGHFTGQMIVGEGPGRIMHFEIHLEMQVALVLLARKELVELEEQVAYEWTDEHGSLKTHFFDFRSLMEDGRRVAISVKPSCRLSKDNFIGEMAQISSQVKRPFADDVRIVTERHLDPVELYNAELLHGAGAPDVEADEAAERAVSWLNGAVSLEQLTEALGLGARGFRALLRLIAAHRVLPVTSERITKNTLIYSARAS